MALNRWAISLEQADTLPGAFRRRVAASPQARAYVQYLADEDRWYEYSWAETARAVQLWQGALAAEALDPGDRVAVMCRNRWEWAVFDQAALGLGLVTVPLYPNDRPDNVAWILQDAGVRLLLLESAQSWLALRDLRQQFPALQRVLLLDGGAGTAPLDEPLVSDLGDWLEPARDDVAAPPIAPHSLATIVYTSGTTGRCKGVMLSHHNILWNIQATLQRFTVYPADLFLSFLPLSHTLERTIGYYLPLVSGAAVAFNRSIALLADDLAALQPSLMISVPRIFERMHRRITEQLAGASALERHLFQTTLAVGWANHQHARHAAPWSPRLLFAPLLDRLVASKVRAHLGGRLRLTVCGGAALAPEIARFFIGLGIPVVHGYGLTEASPVIAANPLEDNVPETVGPPIAGVGIRVDERGELLTQSPSVMLGYWQDGAATRQVIDTQGWLHTGDRVELDAAGRIRITGRLKEIIVLANGEKISPADMENAIVLDGLFDQVMLIGEGRPYLSALVVPNPEQLSGLADSSQPGAPDREAARGRDLPGLVLERLQRRLKAFPGYAQVHKLALVPEPWTTDNGLMTPTLKLRRAAILARHHDLVERLYSGH